jgi:hypothetical protein
VTQDEAVAVAKAVAEKQNWAWTEPVRAHRFRRWWFGPPCWRVTTNAEQRGRNVIVTIGDVSREIIQASYAPR